MVFAQISGGKVLNTIILDDLKLSSLFSEGYDNFVDITSVSPQPSVGWLYDGANFKATAFPNDGYGSTVSFSTNGTTDYYSLSSGNTYSFPHGTPQNSVYLAMAIKENISKSQYAIQAFVVSRYSLETRFSFNALYNISLAAGLTNRTAYIMRLFTWASTIIAYAATYVASVQAMTDIPTIVATTPDLGSFVSSDPLLTPVAAIQILT